MRNHGAFALIELLVVVSIIVLLIALLAPAGLDGSEGKYQEHDVSIEPALAGSFHEQLRAR